MKRTLVRRGATWCIYTRVKTIHSTPAQATATTPWTDRHGLAKHQAVSVRTVDSWIAQNLIPFRRLGRRVVFNLEAVEAALARFDVKAKNA